jgi:hypothetical protein
LEQRASVKRFVSLQFLNLRESVGLLRLRVSQSQGRYLTQTDIHALSGFRTHISVVKRAKTFHALDRAATVVGNRQYA